MRSNLWGPHLIVALTALSACHHKDAPGVDTDTGVPDTDTTDTDVVVVDTADTGADQDTDDTDVVDTDGEHVMMHGQLFCTLPTPEVPAGAPAQPGFVKITLVKPWYCPPLNGCTENTNVEVIAETTLDENGVFDLDFQTGPYTVQDLYVYTNVKDGVCGNGYQFTQETLTSYTDWSNIVIDVDSIYY